MYYIVLQLQGDMSRLLHIRRLLHMCRLLNICMYAYDNPKDQCADYLQRKSVQGLSTISTLQIQQFKDEAFVPHTHACPRTRGVMTTNFLNPFGHEGSN